MKKYFSTFLILIPLFSFCQEKVKDPNLFGAALILGFNASQVDGDNDAGFHKIGFNGGATAFIRFHPNISTSFEILYSQKGSKTAATKHFNPSAFQINLDYLEVPVLINFHDKKVAIFSVGISFNRLIKGKRTIGGFEQPINNIGSGGTCIDICINEKTDFNFVGGVTFTFKEHFGFNVRYAYSLGSMGYSTVSKFKNHNLYNHLISFRLMGII